MQQLEFDFSEFENEEPTKERVWREFVATTSVAISVDPTEFRGMSVPQITEELKSVLKSIKPDADFFEMDIVLAANELAS